ncbi:MAG TPA: hypothetical protein DCX42_02335 [Planktomarina temperata]|nr:hypothetical protein [Planktomarina temperata]
MVLSVHDPGRLQPLYHHDTDGPKANHALTFKLDHLTGAAQQYQERLAVETIQSKSQNGAFRRLFNDIKHSARLFEALRKDNVLTTGDRMMATNNNPKAKTVCE